MDGIYNWGNRLLDNIKVNIARTKTADCKHTLFCEPPVAAPDQNEFHIKNIKENDGKKYDGEYCSF